MTKNRKEIISSYVQYLDEIRKKATKIFIFFVIFFLASFFVSIPVLKFFLKFFKIKDVEIMVVSPFQFFSAAFDVALFMAIVMIFPLAVYFIFSFLKTALTKKEIRAFKKIILPSFFLFVCGFLFGLSVMYYAIVFLAGFNSEMGVANMWDISLFISQLLLASAMLGIIFQYPIILTILIRLGVISSEQLREKRRWAILGSVVVASVLPPPDVLATIIMVIPLLLLFEATILLNRKSGAKKVEVPQLVLNN